MIACHRLLLAACLTLLALVPARAGEFVINPLRITLDRTARSSEIVIRNEDTTPLRMQVQAMAWSQSAEGVDKYEDTDALVFFPRAMEIPPGESRVVRVGTRSPPPAREDAYRLFIEELPPPQGVEATERPGATLRVLLRVGVAVFVAPPAVERKAETTALALAGRNVTWTVANPGNVHVRADQIEIVGLGRDGRQLFAYAVPDRYVLAGVTRTIRYEVPAQACADLVAIEATLLADRVDQRRKIDVAPGVCK